MTKGLNSAILSIKEIIEILEKYAPQSEGLVAELNEQINNIETEDLVMIKKGLKHAGSMTHPKWLGDTYLENISFADWLKALDRMGIKCSRALKQLEKE